MLPALRRTVVAILTLEARLTLARFKPKIIAVTGSVGKTTTKDAIFAALAGEMHVRKSAKSFNSDLGVPLTILGLDNAWNNPLLWAWNIMLGAVRLTYPHAYPEWLVLEIGADRPGDIQKIARWLRPDITVITGIPEIPAHIEFFRSPQELLKEKRTLAEYLKPGGKLILNGDDAPLRDLRSEFRGATITYGLESMADFRARDIEIEYEESFPRGMRFRIERDGFSLPVAVHGALGTPRVYAVLAAFAVGECTRVDPVSIASSLLAWDPPPGRVRIIPGKNGSVIIDDTYNSSPAAALAALDILEQIHAKRRIAILGDMLELGKYTKDAHRRVGERAAQVADSVITLGIRARSIGEAALDAGMRDESILEYELGESKRIGDELAPQLQPGDIVLVKGSQSMRMERTVKKLMAEPKRAKDLLVRMDTEWNRR